VGSRVRRRPADPVSVPSRPKQNEPLRRRRVRE
jgi:hypothetical protein